jgi:hypothetical protein
VFNNYELTKDEFINACKRFFMGLTPTEKDVLLGVNKNKKHRSYHSLNTTFRPEIDSFSSAIATKRRPTGLSIEDKLIEEGRMAQNKLYERQKQKKSVETENCTFSPTINTQFKK